MEQFLSGITFNGIPMYVFVIWGGITLFSLILAISTAIIASRKGRHGFGWFLIGLFTGILGLAIILVALPKRYYFEEEE
jgi:hypothetical protein